MDIEHTTGRSVMGDKKSRNLLLLAILLVAFLYRFALTTMNIFPPGADIGLHESVIKSIMAPKPTFFYNYYHMGGGLSVTNPGYHIFSAFMITMTGAPRLSGSSCRRIAIFCALDSLCFSDC